MIRKTTVLDVMRRLLQARGISYKFQSKMGSFLTFFYSFFGFVDKKYYGFLLCSNERS